MMQMVIFTEEERNVGDEEGGLLNRKRKKWEKNDGVGDSGWRGREFCLESRENSLSNIEKGTGLLDRRVDPRKKMDR